MSVSHIEITESISSLRHSIFLIRGMLDGMARVAMEDDGTAALLAMARTTEATADKACIALDEITEWCRAVDDDRAEREKLASELAETDEGQALRDMARDMARQIEQICTPAFQAITQMQNGAGELDAMIQRARDMAGCYRPIHSANRDPDRPEGGSLCETVGEAMDPRTLRFAAAIERARARSLAMEEAA